MALIDMYEILHNYTVGATNYLNVYQVERANAGELAGTINVGFLDQVLPIVRLFQDTAVDNKNTVIRNLGDSLDFGEFNLSPAPGLRTGVETADFLAGGVKFPRLRSDMKSGFKRYGPLNEGDTDGNNLVPATVTLLNNIGAACVADWTDPGDSHVICRFVIIKRICTITPPVGEPCPQYRLPETDGELLFYTPSQGVALSTVRSQVSRRVRAS